MNRRFEGRWRWAVAVAVFVGVSVGLLLPDDWHVLLNGAVVGAVTALCLVAAVAVRERTGR